MPDTRNEIDRIKKSFKKATDKRQWSMAREKAIPIIIPPVIVAGGLFAAMLGAWDVLPAMGQKIAVMGSAAATAATGLWSLTKVFNKNTSPFVSQKKAIRAIDEDIGDDSMPASKMADTPASDNIDGWSDIFELSKKKIWDKHGDAISNQKRKSGLGKYYNNGKSFKALSHGVVLSAAIATASLNGDGALQKFTDAWNFTPPPPPLSYTAWVTPPSRITDAPIYQDGMLKSTLAEDEYLPAHEGSILSIITDDREGEILINGQRLQPETLPLEAQQNRSTTRFTYTVPLDEGDVNINIEGHVYNFSITPDNPPDIEIINSHPDDLDPNSLVLEYTITDDFGAAGAEISIGVRDKEGNRAAPLLPSAQIPSITIPHTDRPDGP